MDASPPPALHGQAPIVIGHRGAAGYRPEHTLESYRLAIEQGADFIEPDVVATRDGQLIARHENVLATVALQPDGKVAFDANGKPIVTGATSNVATFDGNGDGKPDFYDKLTVKTVDEEVVGGWFTEDFTLAEIKELRARERIPEVRPVNARFDDRFRIPTLGEVLDLIEKVEAERGRKVGIYPETKHPTYFAVEGTHQNEDANGNGALDAGEDLNGNGRLDVVDGGAELHVNLGQAIVDTLVDHRFTDPSRVFIQSFEAGNLVELHDEIMPAAGVDLPLVQLLGSGGPPADEQAIAAYADAVGPPIGLILPTEALATPIDSDGDGQPDTFSRLTGEVTDFVRRAHDAGLLVHPYTLRAEPAFVPATADGQPQSVADLERRLIEAGVDGFFTDNPDIGRATVDKMARD